MQLQQEFSCRIPHHKVINKKTVYVVIFVSHSFCQAKVHHFRYSDAEKLHHKIEKQLTQLRIPLNLPDFPGKKLFGSHNDTKEGILRRRSDLQDYFNQLLKIDKLYSLPSIKQLLPELNGEKCNLNEYLQDKPLQQYNFVIDSYQQLDMFVLYFIQVIDNFNKTKWRFKARYSDLRDIHQALKDQQRFHLPDFPKRKIFGITNDDPQQIESRRKGLETYLNSIYADPELVNTDILDYFVLNSRRESKKLQKFDEQKMLLKLKLKQKHQQQQQLEEFKKQLNNNNNNNNNNDILQLIETNNEKPLSKLVSHRKGLFIIKELLDQYEDDHTTLLRYCSISSTPQTTIKTLEDEDHTEDYLDSEPQRYRNNTAQ